jgi:hypothetical protein
MHEYIQLSKSGPRAPIEANFDFRERTPRRQKVESQASTTWTRDEVSRAGKLERRHFLTCSLFPRTRTRTRPHHPSSERRIDIVLCNIFKLYGILVQILRYNPFFPNNGSRSLHYICARRKRLVFAPLTGNRFTHIQSMTIHIHRMPQTNVFVPSFFKLFLSSAMVRYFTFTLR